MPLLISRRGNHESSQGEKNGRIVAPVDLQERNHESSQGERNGGIFAPVDLQEKSSAQRVKALVTPVDQQER